MRSVYLYLLVSLAVSCSAMADPVPYDPQILIDTGGDATDVNYTGKPITVGINGGGIFQFHNATGSPLTELDLNLDFPLSPLPTGFTVQGTISAPPSLVRQHSTFNVTTFSGLPCTGATTGSCIELKFILMPGPLIPTDGNFILDFNNSADYTAADLGVLDGTYSGPDVPDGTGGWAPGGVQTFGMVDPIPAVPEPSYRTTAACMGLVMLVAWSWRRRLTARKS
jgi:hypothetical protein